MVHPPDALLADTAMFGPSRFEQVTGLAGCARVEEREIVRVAGHFAHVRLGVDGAWVREGGEVEEEVREKDGEDAEGFVSGRKVRPGVGEVEVFAY